MFIPYLAKNHKTICLVYLKNANIYKIIDIKFIKSNREIRPISDFKGIEEKFYDGLRLAEQQYNICQDQGDDMLIMLTL